MGAVETLPRGAPLTRDDLDSMPDDGHRYELIDGSLLVTPAPSWPHQRGVGRLFAALDQACPPGLEVLLAPFDVVLATDTVVQPDVLVARVADLTVRDLPTAPVLAVEVCSPGTRHIDLALKRSRYEAAGCVSYWVIDPDVPSITAWELNEGRYVEAQRATGDTTFTTSRPFTVDLTPAALFVDRRRSGRV